MLLRVLNVVEVNYCTTKINLGQERKEQRCLLPTTFPIGITTFNLIIYGLVEKAYID